MSYYAKHIMWENQAQTIIYAPAGINFSTFMTFSDAFALIPKHEYDKIIKEMPYNLAPLLRTLHLFNKIPTYHRISEDLARRLFRDEPHLPGSTGYPDDWANENYNSPL